MNSPVLGPTGAVLQNQNSVPCSPPTNGMQLHPSMAHPGELLPTGSFDPMNPMAAAAAQGFPPGPQGQGPPGSQGQGPPGSQGQGAQKSPATVNEAMEKLCESMRRSAMSRSLVKQLSGRNLSRQNSARGLQRQNSGRLTKQLSTKNLSRTNSGRNLVRANSGRALQRTQSGRAALGPEDGSNLPVRRIAQSSKHRIQRDAVSSGQGPPGRGVFRHKSQSAIIGMSQNNAPQMMLQIDDSTVGMF
jgi:hypothetical protein